VEMIFWTLFVFVCTYLIWPNNMISISTCVEFYGDQEYAKYRSCDLGIIVKKVFLLVFCRFLYNKKVMWYESSIFLMATELHTFWDKNYISCFIFNIHEKKNKNDQALYNFYLRICTILWPSRIYYFHITWPSYCREICKILIKTLFSLLYQGHMIYT